MKLDEARGALSGTLVVDVSEGVAGASCTRLLADLGADVVKVESPSGDPLRSMGPFPGGVADRERSGMFLHFNANKRGIVLDLDDPDGRARLAGLVSEADVLVESFPRARSAALGLTYESASALNPRLTAVSITPFGLSGPYASWRSDEIVEWAMGGWMYFIGDPAREPLLVPGHQAALHAGHCAAMGALAALRAARRSGLGQQVEISHFESMAVAHMIHTSSWSQEGRLVKRTGVNATRANDGFVWFQSGVTFDTFFILIDKPELLADPAYATLAARAGKIADLNKMLTEWCAEHSKVEIETSAQELRMPVTAARDIAELVDDHPQMTAREFFLTIDHPRAGATRHAGFPYKLSATPCRVERPAPLLGQHTDEVLARTPVAAIAGRGDSPTVASAGAWHTQTRDTAPDSDAPFAGVNVLEITAYWGGPLIGRWLADLGADVIKVEFAQRRARRARRTAESRTPPPSEDASPALAALAARDPYNRGLMDNKMNPGKRSVALDLGIPEGKDIFLKLVQWADVVVENNSARVMPNFGLAYENLKEVKPDVIMLSMSGFGATGPWRDYGAFGSNIEASGGLMSLTGYGPGENWRTGSFYGDPVGGNLATVAVMAALLHRDTTGEGQHIDLSLNEATVGMFAGAVLDYTMNGVVRQPAGNRSLDHAPQGAYPGRREDSWVALVVRDETEWDALCRVVGSDELAGRADLRTADGRRDAHDVIDEAIRSWSRGQDHHQSARLLQAAGVPAGPVLTNREMVRDPHLFERGFFVFVRQPGMGVLPYPGWPWKLSRTPASVRRHPPLYAEHNREVFRDVLGLSDQEIEELYESGATADQDYSGLAGAE